MNGQTVCRMKGRKVIRRGEGVGRPYTENSDILVRHYCYVFETLIDSGLIGKDSRSPEDGDYRVLRMFLRRPMDDRYTEVTEVD